MVARVPWDRAGVRRKPSKVAETAASWVGDPFFGLVHYPGLHRDAGSRRPGDLRPGAGRLE